MMKFQGLNGRRINTQTYLIHHGIKGQKHGVRNAEWYPIEDYKKHLRNAKDYQKELNKNEQKYVDAAGNYMRSDMRANKIAKKGVNYINKHDANPTDRDAQKLKNITNDLDKANKEREFYKKQMEEAEAYTWKLMADASFAGLSVESKEVEIASSSGKSAAFAFRYLGGLPAGIAYAVAVNEKYGSNYQTEMANGKKVNQNHNRIVANKYKVRR